MHDALQEKPYKLRKTIAFELTHFDLHQLIWLQDMLFSVVSVQFQQKIQKQVRNFLF